MDRQNPLILLLESEDHRYAVLVRPRRFGKTFFQTLLRAYYDRAASADFELNFQGTYIAGTPTEERNALYVLLINYHCPDSGCRLRKLSHPVAPYFFGIRKILSGLHPCRADLF